MMKREWSCHRKIGGYLIQLDCGDNHLCSFVDNEMLQSSLSPIQYIEYHIIRLNTQLAQTLLPLAQTLDHRRYK